MKKICNKHHECNSPTCEHKEKHQPLGDWCADGTCRWAADCHCVDAMAEEILEILVRYFDIGAKSSYSDAAKEIAALMEGER